MFEYTVSIDFTMETKNEDFKMDGIKVATYNFDLGLQINEIIELQDVSILGLDKTSHICKITKKEKIIRHHENGDDFIINVFVEIADKDDYEKIRKILKENRPDLF